MNRIFRKFKPLLLPIIFLAGTKGLWAIGMPKGTNVKTVVVSPRKMEIFKSYIGYLKPADRVVLRTETSGTVEKINVEEGKKVEQGRVLVHISTLELELRKTMAQTNADQALSEFTMQKSLFLAESALPPENGSDGNRTHIATRRLKLQEEMARSNYQHSLSEYTVQKRLFDKNISSSSVFEKYENALEINRIRLEQARLESRRSGIIDTTRVENYKNALKISRINLELAEIELNKSKVKAPFSGIVSRKVVQLGGFVQRGSPLLEIMDISQVLARIDIPEKEVRFVEVRKPVSIRFDAIPGAKFKGRIKTLGLEANTRSRCFPAEVVIDNADRTLLPGMMARVEMLARSDSNQIIVPRHAVLERERGSMVFVERNGRAVLKSVKTGETIGENVQILTGLDFGDRLVVVGQDLLSNNETVNVVDSNHKIVKR
ncbi:MAG: efflux RND transporter periplasmic adaptor subunit [Proteobacteria bacterium]|nr:efflux RND transporter periplasmic adaptor subunit [Pseudomonadota bacterium]